MFLENTFIFYFMIVKGMFSSVERESVKKKLFLLRIEILILFSFAIIWAFFPVGTSLDRKNS